MLKEYKKEAIEGLKEIFEAIEEHERCGVEAVLETEKTFLMGKGNKIEFKFTAIFKD